jgi:hypothetical protein
MIMKRQILLLSLFLVGGCAAGNNRIKAVSPNTEVVEAEGMAPIVNNDVTGAKKTSLEDAMKNALGLVIGVYVSQEALVSKAMLLEDNIMAQTEGYIERYSVLRESQENGFYKTRIKALVRKEDLSAKLNALALESKKAGNLTVKFAIEETVDGKPSAVRSAENVLKKRFVDDGFIVSGSSDADIVINGKADSNFTTDAGMGGFISYRAVLSLAAARSGSSDAIAVAQETTGGIDVTKESAANASLVNGAKKAAGELSDGILKFVQERSVVQLTITNVDNLNRLNDVVRSVRSLIEVRDCRVRTYSGEHALVDLDMKKGNSSEIARRLEQLTSVKLKVNQTKTYDIQAELLK